MAPEKATHTALRAALQHYPAVLAAKAALSRKRGYDLEALETWYRSDLAPALQQRGKQGTAHVTKEELQQLMQWKLARGTWRPRLEDLIASNAADEVRRVSEHAFALHQSHLKHNKQQQLQPREIKAVLEAWKPLKGVGAATATALMAAYAPRHFAFMSDEGLTCMGLEHKYTFPHAQTYSSAMLSRVADTQLGLEELERAAYALVAGRKLAPDVVAAPAPEAKDALVKEQTTASQDVKAKASSTAGGAAKHGGSSESKAGADKRHAQKRKAPPSSEGAEASAEAEPRRRSARLR